MVSPLWMVQDAEVLEPVLLWKEQVSERLPKKMEVEKEMVRMSLA